MSGLALTPAERVKDSDAMLRAIRASIREAVLRHKLLGQPIAVWRDDQVVWIQPEDIEVSDLDGE